jgi:hypothetical protein
MKYDELEKKVAEVFKGFELDSVKLEYITYKNTNNENLAKFGVEVENKDFTEITISGVVKEKI